MNKKKRVKVKEIEKRSKNVVKSNVLVEPNYQWPALEQNMYSG